MYSRNKYKWQYPGNATVMKHSPPEMPTEGEIRKKNKNNNNEEIAYLYIQQITYCLCEFETYKYQFYNES